MGEVRLRLRQLLAGSCQETWIPIQPTEGNLDVKGHLCLRWGTELQYGAGYAWKARAFGYFAIHLAQITTLGLTLVHFAQHGYYLYLIGCLLIVGLTGFVSLMFAISVNKPINPKMGDRVRVETEDGREEYGTVVGTPACPSPDKGARYVGGRRCSSSDGTTTPRGAGRGSRGGSRQSSRANSFVDRRDKPRREPKPIKEKKRGRDLMVDEDGEEYWESYTEEDSEEEEEDSESARYSSRQPSARGHTPRTGKLPPLGMVTPRGGIGTSGEFTVEIEVPGCFTDRSGITEFGTPRTGHGHPEVGRFGAGDVWTRAPGARSLGHSGYGGLEDVSVGYHENTDLEPKKMTVTPPPSL
jgi:hypothetical protein